MASRIPVFCSGNIALVLSLFIKTKGVSSAAADWDHSYQSCDSKRYAI